MRTSVRTYGIRKVRTASMLKLLIINYLQQNFNILDNRKKAILWKHILSQFYAISEVAD